MSDAEFHGGYLKQKVDDKIVTSSIEGFMLRTSACDEVISSSPGGTEVVISALLTFWGRGRADRSLSL